MRDDPGTPDLPRCSVIIPAYNAADFVVQAVQSALRQTAEAPEVIVVDDGSEDATAALVDGIKGVTLIRQANQGPSAARMSGFAASRGEFVIFLDADDELAAGAIAAHISALEGSKAAMVFGSNYRINEAGRRIGSNQQARFETRDRGLIALQVTPTPSQCMYRRTAIEAVGGYDLTLDLCEDIDLNLRLSRIGAILCHGEFVANYRMHAGQATKEPAKICRAHLGLMRRHLGADAAALLRCLKKWQRYYGGNIPAEIARSTLRGDVKGAVTALNTFLSCLPQSAIGAVRNVPNLVRRRFG